MSQPVRTRHRLVVRIRGIGRSGRVAVRCRDLGQIISTVVSGVANPSDCIGAYDKARLQKQFRLLRELGGSR